MCCWREQGKSFCAVGLLHSSHVLLKLFKFAVLQLCNCTGCAGELAQLVVFINRSASIYAIQHCRQEEHALPLQ